MAYHVHMVLLSCMKKIRKSRMKNGHTVVKVFLKDSRGGMICGINKTERRIFYVLDCRERLCGCMVHVSSEVPGARSGEKMPVLHEALLKNFRVLLGAGRIRFGNKVGIVKEGRHCYSLVLS